MKTSTKKPLGQRIDEIYLLDKKIDKAQQALKKLTSERTEAERRLLRAFESTKIDKAVGKKGAARINRRKFPTIQNQRKFQKYVKRHNAFDLYQNRVSSKAYFARLEEGDAVPGVEVFEKVTVSVRKRGSK